MARTGIYIRRASKVDSDEVQTEIRELKNFVCSNKNQVVATYIDNGYSGMDTNRPALKSLLDDCANGKLDEVVVLRTERLSRNAHDFYELHQKICSNNVSLIIVENAMAANSVNLLKFMGV